MKKYLIALTLVGFAFTMVPPQAMANKQFSDQFKKIYAGDDADEAFKELVAEAKCNVCHVDKEDKKKIRNPFGKALHELLEKDNFPTAEFKKEPEKFADRLKDLLKKVEEQEISDPEHKTFGARIEAKLLPGGDILGKGLTDDK